MRNGDLLSLLMKAVGWFYLIGRPYYEESLVGTVLIIILSNIMEPQQIRKCRKHVISINTIDFEYVMIRFKLELHMYLNGVCVGMNYKAICHSYNLYCMHEGYTLNMPYTGVCVGIIVPI